MDAKATVKIGSFSRGGKSRVVTSGCDHDYQPSTKLTPYGIFLPELKENILLLSSSITIIPSELSSRFHRWQKLSPRFNVYHIYLTGLSIFFLHLNKLGYFIFWSSLNYNLRKIFPLTNRITNHATKKGSVQ